ncbi:MAG: hypothetical protein V2I33_26390 [Kangiellaceae bacterium]|nr:hypothetical protein [Kangiellaceae bacterium]
MKSKKFVFIRNFGISDGYFGYELSSKRFQVVGGRYVGIKSWGWLDALG